MTIPCSSMRLDEHPQIFPSGKRLANGLPIGRQARQKLQAEIDPLVDTKEHLPGQDRIFPQERGRDFRLA
jgi:hypothetical protein